MPLDILIEGLLFYRSAPQKKSVLQKMYGVSAEDFSHALETLSARLQTGAVRMLETENDVELVTAPELAPFIEAVRKGDIKSDIGKAGAETLAIVLYRNPITRTEIDRIRGVNSSFILRNLLIRGLIERSQTKQGSGYTFGVTPALLAHLGVTSSQQLTDFSRVTDALETFTHDSTPANLTETSV